MTYRSLADAARTIADLTPHDPIRIVVFNSKMHMEWLTVMDHRRHTHPETLKETYDTSEDVELRITPGFPNHWCLAVTQTGKLFGINLDTSEVKIVEREWDRPLRNLAQPAVNVERPIR